MLSFACFFVPVFLGPSSETGRLVQFVVGDLYPLFPSVRSFVFLTRRRRVSLSLATMQCVPLPSFLGVQRGDFAILAPIPDCPENLGRRQPDVDGGSGAATYAKAVASLLS